MKVLVLGISGMLGSAVFRVLRDRRGAFDVVGTSRSEQTRSWYPELARSSIISGVDAENTDALIAAFASARPEVVINCIGVVKQAAAAKDPLITIPINSILPHRLARLAALFGARLVHISTDCVFSGRKGGYRESDPPDAEDLYGRSKLLGEVDAPGAVTLRTSIIGREPFGRYGLLEWFLNTSGPVRGYARSVFSGLTTDELTRVIADHVLPHRDLRGVYHVSTHPIDKYTLLTLFKDAYGLDTAIERDEGVVLDRSLDSTRFQAATGYAPPAWRDMIRRMQEMPRAA